MSRRLNSEKQQSQFFGLLLVMDPKPNIAQMFSMRCRSGSAVSTRNPNPSLMPRRSASFRVRYVDTHYAQSKIQIKIHKKPQWYPLPSVADPDPHPDPYVFGPHGYESWSVSHKHGFGSKSGSGSFYHHVKIVRKTVICTFLWLL